MIRAASCAFVAAAALFAARHSSAAVTYDDTYASYRQLLARVVHGPRVDYRDLAAHRAALDSVVDDMGRVPAAEEARWPRAERFAFWINAYNVLTLRSIVDHYPIRGSRLSLAPRNSIRQIDGVWTARKWAVAGRQLTLDQIEHEILRPTFKDPRVHVAINCASKSCPPLALEPYVGRDLDRQLDDAARRFLASEHGVQLAGGRLLVSSIFKWYGADFMDAAARPGEPAGGDVDSALRRFVARHGPAAAADAARANAAIRFLGYDWSLNDVDR